MGNIKIVLADDHTLIREGTRHLLEQYPGFEVIGEAEDGQRALELIKQLKPDVAILDIRMPKLNGIEVVKSLKQCSPATKTLILTAYDDDDYIFALMNSGVSGYQLKTASAKELADAVSSVHAGELVLHPTIAVKIARLWALRGTSVPVVSAEQLSTRELEILKLAAKGLRNKAIADSLNINVRTVEGCFNSIFAKLGVSSRIEAVLCVLSRNLITLEKE